MKLNLLKFALKGGLILSIIFIANSCKKDLKNQSQQTSLDKIREELSKLPRQTVLASNEKATSIMCDVDGNPI